MPRSYIGKSKRSLGRIFKRNTYLRKRLSSSQKKTAKKILSGYQGGRGISFRGGPGVRSEVDKAYGVMRRNKKDGISTSEAKRIRKELKKYGRSIQQDTHHRRTSRDYFKKHSDHFSEDPRAGSNRPYRGDPDNKPNLLLGESKFDDSRDFNMSSTAEDSSAYRDDLDRYADDHDLGDDFSDINSRD